MSALHDAAIRQYTEHYARMNSAGLDADQVAPRTYRNMELMYGPLVDGLRRGSAVVDIGCGAGFFLHWLSKKPGLRLLGVDACADQADCARRAAPGAEIVVQDGLAFLENKSSKFAGVFCIDMVEHIETDEECFRFLRGVQEALEPGGFLVCRVPNAAHVLSSHARYVDRIFTTHSMRQALRAAGFRDVRFIPHRSSSWLGKLRLGLEYLFHRTLFLLCGYPKDAIYTENLVAVGFKS